MPDEGWDSFTKARGSPCDPQPLSPYVTDACGVCGGDNSTCGATVELLVADRSEASELPLLGAVIATARARPGRAAPFALPLVNRICMGVSRGRPKTAVSDPGQGKFMRGQGSEMMHGQQVGGPRSHLPSPRHRITLPVSPLKSV